jgi:flavin-binding protein dodecin
MREYPWQRDGAWRDSLWAREGDWRRQAAWLRDGSARWAETEGPWVTNVLDITAESPISWDDASRRALVEARASVRGIRSLWIEDMIAVPDEEHGVVFRIHARVAFGVEDNRRRR